MFRGNLRVEGQQYRRTRWLQRQRDKRKESVARMRGLNQGPAEAEVGKRDNARGESAQTKKDRGREKRERQQIYFCSMLQIPEWMVEIPSDLGPENWMVCARPEGQRCLVISQGGRTISRKKNGAVMKTFDSLLPSGCGGRGHGESTILECVFHEADQTYYVLDILQWKGFNYCDSTAEFRFYWMQSKLAEIEGICSVSDHNQYRFQPIPMFKCDRTGLESVYTSTYQYQKDGLVFYNKDGHYVGGLTPLVLSWKDSATSRYPIDTPDGINPYPVQMCVLRFDEANPTLLRAVGGDVVSIVDFSSLRGAHDLKPGGCARFIVRSPVTSSHDKNFMTSPEDSLTVHIFISSLEFHSKCKSWKQPDSSCRIAFQYAMRTAPLTIQKIGHSITG